jgi:hypothetical protein
MRLNLKPISHSIHSRSAFLSALGLTFALTLSGCWVKPAAVKKDAALTDAKPGETADGKDSKKTSSTECVDVAISTSSPEGAVAIKDAKDLIDGKGGDYELRRVVIHQAQNDGSGNAGSASLEISIERKNEALNVNQESIRSKVLCSKSSGKGMELAIENEIVDAFSRTEGIFSTRRILKSTFPAMIGPKAPEASALPIDAVDENNQKEKRMYGLGDPRVAALGKAPVACIAQAVYRLSPTLIEVRVTRSEGCTIPGLSAKSYAAQYELVTDDAPSNETPAPESEEPSQGDVTFSAIRGAGAFAPVPTTTQIEISGKGLVTKTVREADEVKTIHQADLTDAQVKELAACAVEAEKAPALKETINCADDEGTAYYLGLISGKQIALQRCAQKQTIEAKCVTKVVDLFDSLLAN